MWANGSGSSSGLGGCTLFADGVQMFLFVMTERLSVYFNHAKAYLKGTAERTLWFA